MVHLMETLNEPNAAQVDRLMTSQVHAWMDAHTHTLVLKWLLFHYAAVCFRLQALRTHFQLLNLTTLFSCSICCRLSLCFSSSTSFFSYTTFSSLPHLCPRLSFLSHPSLPLSHRYHPTLSACLSSMLSYLSPSLHHFTPYLTLYGLWCRIDSQTHS